MESVTNETKEEEGVRVDLAGLMKELMVNGWDCANAKNIGDWYFGEFPGKYNRENNKYEYLYLAMNTWYVSDYVKAAEMYRYLLQTYAECPDEDRRCMEERLQIFEAREAQAQAVDCPDERLGAVIHRLRYVFGAISRPIRVFIAESEADFDSFYARQFPGADPYAYGDFVATGIYYDKGEYWLVFKRDVVDELDDEALTGLCAHEMAHLDLDSQDIPSRFRGFPEIRVRAQMENSMINERLTDLYVLSKGLAYSLYRERLYSGASRHLMTAANIAEYIQKIEN